jgi:hypothetical protein
MLPDAAGFTAALRGHFSSSALLFHSVTASGFCRLDRQRGSGLASGQSSALWPFVAFPNCFSVGIDELLSGQTKRSSQLLDIVLPFPSRTRT